MTIQLNVGIRNILVDSIAENLGNGGGVVDLYTGAQPASADAAATGVLLVSIPIDTFTQASGGAAGLSSAAVGYAVATGTAGYARWRDLFGGTLRIDGSVGTSGADFIVSSTNISAIDEEVTLTQLNLSQPAS